MLLFFKTVCVASYPSFQLSHNVPSMSKMIALYGQHDEEESCCCCCVDDDDNDDDREEEEVNAGRFESVFIVILRADDDDRNDDGSGCGGCGSVGWKALTLIVDK